MIDFKLCNYGIPGACKFLSVKKLLKENPSFMYIDLAPKSLQLHFSGVENGSK